MFIFLCAPFEVCFCILPAKVRVAVESSMKHNTHKLYILLIDH